ncbi:MAG: hypothetical protein EZS28_022195 [Streblomastix strix]|uniref:Uncharacterized protein n=1 Tax=Streblomastix strix TaxID=222440 RepID=A0A5J4VI65_9EUKA|nr:MAG: hypothetical protein EZS28_022195 [Streblomastix strix]
MELLECLACSPDLSPIENVQSVNVRKVYAEIPAFDSEEQLWRKIQRVIKGIKKEEIIHFVESIGKRIVRCAQNKYSYVNK